MQKVEFSGESWDKKKIILTVFLLAGLIIGAFGLKTYLLGSDDSNSSSNSKSNTQSSVKGAMVSPGPTISLPSVGSIGQSALQNLNNVKQEINKLNVQELATSSPQIQKIVNDIKSLPAIPGQQAKDICLKICNGL